MPTMLMGLIQSMIPVIDGLFINNLAGTDAASAITYCTPIIMMMTALAQGLSVAGMAMIGQMNGRGEINTAKQVATQIFVATFFVGCLAAPLLAILSIPISGGVNSDISHNVFLYLALSSIVQPFSFLEFVYNAIKNANGKPEAPFVRMLIMLFLKIAFNFIFIGVLGYGIIGSVVASFIANLLISVWMFFELFVMKSEDRLEIRGFRFDLEIIKEMFKIGIPAMISTVMLNLGFFLINNETEKYGSVTLNGQGIANNITAVCFILPSSFGTSVTTMVSMNVGAGNGLKAKKACLVGCFVSAVTAVVLIAVIVPLAPYLTILFTRQPDVLLVANKALHIYTFSVVGFGICMVELGAFIGLGRTVVPLIVNILRVWALRYVFILATERFLGVYSVFWGNLFSNYMAAAITTILLLRVTWVSVIDTKSIQSVDV
jgi:putative MATE family efflux protein